MKTIPTYLGSLFQDVREEVLHERLKGPVECPCCSQQTRVWKKRPISTAVASLCRLVRQYRGFPIHLEYFNVPKSDRNFSQLALWWLIKRAENSDKKKRTSGMYSPTALGTAFARSEMSIPRYVYTLNDEVIKTEGPDIMVKDALGDKFDYSELMGLQGQTQLELL